MIETEPVVIAGSTLIGGMACFQVAPFAIRAWRHPKQALRAVILALGVAFWGAAFLGLLAGVWGLIVWQSGAHLWSFAAAGFVCAVFVQIALAVLSRRANRGAL